MQVAQHPGLHRCCRFTHSSSSSSRLRHSIRRPSAALLPAPQLHPSHFKTSLLRAAASDQPPQQPDRAADGAQQQQQPTEQQQVEQLQQQLEAQQQPLAARAAESEAASALLAATTAAAHASADEADEEDEEEIDPELLQLQQELEQQQQEWELQNQRWCRTARNVYLLLAVGLTAAGALVSVAAGPIAGTGLKLGLGLPVQQATVLVGCFGAAVIRAASLAWFLAEGAALGELGSWRYQRINLGLAVAALAAATAAATAGWAGAQPWLVLLLLGGCGATAAAALGMAFGQARHEGFYFASALGYGDVFQAFGATCGYLLYNVTCLAGALMTAMAVAGAVLGAAALAGSALLPSLPWVAAGNAGVGAATLLHKLLGAGLLLLALQAWVLTEYASNARDISPELATKLLYVRNAEEVAFREGQLGPAPVHAPVRRFDLLHVGFVAAAVAQGLWLAQAAAAGPGLGLLNVGDPLWGSLFWGVMGSGLYLLVLLAKMDFLDVWVSWLRVVDWMGSLVSLGAAVLFVDWIWLAPARPM